MAPTTSPAVIPPRKRQKLTTTACEPCRNRKIRCDGNKPTCEACAKRSQPCVYQATTDVKHVNTYVDSLVQRVSQLEQELENARATILRLSTSPSIPVPPPPQVPLAPPPPHHTTTTHASIASLYQHIPPTHILLVSRARCVHTAIFRNGDGGGCGVRACA